MADIFDLVDSKMIGEYVTTMKTEPMLLETFFPNKKIVGLELKYLVGYKGLPIALKPSALGARAFTRDRIGVSQLTHELPFYREQMPIDERMRQDLMRAKLDVTDPYTASVLDSIFNDRKELVDGAMVQSERQRAQLLTTGKVHIVSANKDGKDINQEYEYDKTGKWAKNNVKTLTGSAKWSNHASADPIADLNAMKERADSMGVKLERIIMSHQDWQNLKKNANIKSLIQGNPTLGVPVPVTDGRVQNLIKEETGLSVAVYSKTYKDENEQEKAYWPNGVVVALPAGTMGYTVYGTTPEEADLNQGFGNASVTVVNTGIAITTAKEYGPPVNVKTVVSQLVLPSFENMATVFVLNT